MALNTVNDAIEALNWELVMKMPRGKAIKVCAATGDEWDAFVESDVEKVKSTHMEWINGAIYIVEVPTSEHGNFTAALTDEVSFNARAGGYNNAICSHGDTFVRARRRILPDASFGPKPDMHRFGAVLPGPFNGDWGEYHTIKVEVGYSRQWGNEEKGQLDWKANQWATFAGVEYVLCVAVSDGLATAEYKLYSVGVRGARLPAQNPTPVVAPTTIVQFDAHRVLGLPAGGGLPPNFPDPYTIDLYAVLVEAKTRRGMQPAPAQQ